MLHPSFVEVLEGDLELVEPLEQVTAPAALTELVVPITHDELVEWVDRILAERLGCVPRKREDGAICILRSGDARLTVRVNRSRPVIAVSATGDAKPFCPEHLDRAIDSTFDYSEEAAGEVRSKLARKASKVDPVDYTIDPDRLLVYGVRTDADAMIEMARALTGGSRTAPCRSRCTSSPWPGPTS